MKTVWSFVVSLLRWALRGALPVATFGALWWPHRREPREAIAGVLAGMLCAFVVILWAEVEELKARVRDLSAPAERDAALRERIWKAQRAARAKEGAAE